MPDPGNQQEEPMDEAKNLVIEMDGLPLADKWRILATARVGINEWLNFRLDAYL